MARNGRGRRACDVSTCHIGRLRGESGAAQHQVPVAHTHHPSQQSVWQ
jgi:hypothetical protein